MVFIPDNPKDPGATLNYGIDWQDDDTPWLATGDSIASSTWTVPSGITKESDSSTSTTTTIKISGGTLGAVYDLVNRITTSVSGEIDERTIRITIGDR